MYILTLDRHGSAVVMLLSVFTHTHTHVHTYTHTHIHTYTHTHIHTHEPRARARARAHTHTHTHTHAHIHTHLHTHTLSLSHTHKHTRSSASRRAYISEYVCIHESHSKSIYLCIICLHRRTYMQMCTNEYLQSACIDISMYVYTFRYLSIHTSTHAYVFLEHANVKYV